MATNINAIHDDNAVPTAIFVQQGAPTFVAPGQINELTGRVLVDVSGSTGNNFVYNEIVSGSGTSFTLANSPIAGPALYGQGQRLYPTQDYTISGENITTINSWISGQILADYQY